MKRRNKLSNAIGNLDDSFILEAYTYHPRQKLRRIFRSIGVVTGICLLIEAIL